MDHEYQLKAALITSASRFQILPLPKSSKRPELFCVQDFNRGMRIPRIYAHFRNVQSCDKLTQKKVTSQKTLKKSYDIEVEKLHKALLSG